MKRNIFLITIIVTICLAFWATFDFIYYKVSLPELIKEYIIYAVIGLSLFLNYHQTENQDQG